MQARYPRSGVEASKSFSSEVGICFPLGSDQDKFTLAISEKHQSWRIASETQAQIPSRHSCANPNFILFEKKTPKTSLSFASDTPSLLSTLSFSEKVLVEERRQGAENSHVPMALHT